MSTAGLGLHIPECGSDLAYDIGGEYTDGSRTSKASRSKGLLVHEPHSEAEQLPRWRWILEIRACLTVPCSPCFTNPTEPLLNTEQSEARMVLSNHQLCGHGGPSSTDPFVVARATPAEAAS